MVAVLNYKRYLKDVGYGSLNVEIDAESTEVANGFVMSNSLYYENGSFVSATPVTGANVITEASTATPTEDELKDKVVDIYVDRVLAKVKADWTSIAYTGGTIKVKDDKITPTFDIEGVGVARFTNKSNLIKKSIDHNNIWDDLDNFRYDWATSCTFDPNNGYAPYKDYNATKEVKAAKKNYFYAQENTDQTNFTYLLATGLVKIKGEAQSFGQIQGDDVYYLDQTNNSDLLQALADRLNFNEIKNDGADWTAANLKWASLPTNSTNAYLTYAVLADGITNTAATAFLAADANKVYYWNGGRTYWFMPIEHYTDAGNNVYNGLVRNFVYDYTLTGMLSLGTPVVNPDQPIIPERPKNDPNEYSLVGNVKINAWKVVSHGNSVFE